MIKPDARLYHSADPAYLYGLIDAAGLTQVETARRCGITARTLRNYLSGYNNIPYAIQYTVEGLVPRDYVAGKHWDMIRQRSVTDTSLVDRNMSSCSGLDEPA